MKYESPAYLRNREPIFSVLEPRLPGAGTVLEIASGPGAHARYLAERLPHLTFQPSDVDPRAVAACREQLAEAPLANVRAPLRLDAGDDPWPTTRADAILAINVIHISPFPRTAVGLFRGAAQLLPSGGHLFTYGPFLRQGVETAPSNLAFSDSLRARNPEWGVRSVEELSDLAGASGIELEELVEVPANNLVLVWTKR